MNKYQWTSSNTTKKSQWRSSKKQAHNAQIAKATGLLISNTSTNSLNSHSQKPQYSKKSQWILFITIKRNQWILYRKIVKADWMRKAVESLIAKAPINNLNNPNPIHFKKSQSILPRKQAHPSNQSPPSTLKSQSATAKCKTAQWKTTTYMASPKSERKMNPKSKNTKKVSW